MIRRFRRDKIKPMEEKREYWAFISYRHLDNRDPGRDWASWIAREIETYDVPPELVGTRGARGDEIPERIYPVFRDEDELSAEEDLSSPIYEALRNSRTLVVVCSPQAVASRYVGNEIAYFKSIGRSDRVLAMMIEGEPHDSGDRECFPQELKHPVNEDRELDRSVDVEPVAADFRLPDGTQGWTSVSQCRRHLPDKRSVENYRERCELAKLKLIAGILGVPLGVLVERDKAYQLEQAKRRARIFTAVAAAMAVLAVLAVFGGVLAWINAEEAARERDRAQESERVALQARGTAEELIGEMLFDLGGKLEPIGRLDLLEDVSISAENYFENLPPDQVDAETERNRGVMLDSRAAVLEAAGNLEDALERHREALDIARRLASGEPGVFYLEKDVILSLKNVADILDRQNRVDEAMALYREAAERLRRLADDQLGPGATERLYASLRGENGEEARVRAEERLRDSPGIVELMAASGILNERFAKAAAAAGRTGEALDHYENEIEIFETLVMLGHSLRNSKESLLSAYYNTAALKSLIGEEDEATRLLRKIVALTRAELEESPSDAVWQERLAASLERLASIATLSGDPGEACRLVEEALEIREALAAADPTNLSRQSALYVAHSQLALAKKGSGEMESAERHFERRREIAERLVAADPTNADWRQNLAWAISSMGHIHAADGKLDEAKTSFDESIRHQRIVTEGDGSNLARRRNLFLALNDSAFVSLRQEQAGEAVRLFEESSRIAESIVADLAEPTGQSLKDLSEICSTLGQIARERGDLDEAIAWSRKALQAARQAHDLGLGWEGLSEDVLQRAGEELTKLEKQNSPRP